MMKTYYGYTRVSTAKQGEGVSLEAQKEAIQHYADKNGLQVNLWFEEKETAAKLGRPIFSKMISLLQGHKADGVIMHKIDRSARNLRDWATVGELQDDGVEVHFAAESVDFASRGGRLTADIQAVIAADYIRNLREETIKGITGRLKQGLYPFKAPIGYLNNGGGKVKTIDPIRGPLINELFNLYNTGQYSFKSLAVEISRCGLRSSLGNKIHRSKIERILGNSFYMGLIEVCTTGDTYPGIHEPIITAEVFNSVQAKRVGKRRKKKTKHNFLYRGIFSCLKCRNSMIPERQRGHVYYRCHTSNCSMLTVREEVFEEAVISKLNEIEINPVEAGEFANKLEKRVNRLTKPASGYKNTILKAELDVQFNRLTDALVKGIVDEDTYKLKHRELSLKKMELSAENKNRVTKDEKKQTIRYFLEHAKNLAQAYLSAHSIEKRQILDLCFSNMTVQGRNPLLETRSWIVQATNMQCVLYGGLYDGEYRSGSKLEKHELEEATNVLVCPDMDSLVELCDRIKNRGRSTDLPKAVTTG